MGWLCVPSMCMCVCSVARFEPHHASPHRLRHAYRHKGHHASPHKRQHATARTCTRSVLCAAPLRPAFNAKHALPWGGPSETWLRQRWACQTGPRLRWVPAMWHAGRMRTLLAGQRPALCSNGPYSVKGSLDTSHPASYAVL
eukprot:283396-Chlamydomonas_euryale.AAC.7